MTFELYVPVRHRTRPLAGAARRGSADHSFVSLGDDLRPSDRHRMLDRQGLRLASSPLGRQRLCGIHPQHALSHPALLRLLRLAELRHPHELEYRGAGRDGDQSRRLFDGDRPLRRRSDPRRAGGSGTGAGASPLPDRPLHHPLSRAEGGLPGPDQSIHPRAPRIEHRVGDRRRGAARQSPTRSIRRHSEASRSTRSSRSST